MANPHRRTYRNCKEAHQDEGRERKNERAEQVQSKRKRQAFEVVLVGTLRSIESP
jgi:hypothetical protein